MRVDLSIFAKPIEEQIKDYGYEFKTEDKEGLYNKLIHSWNMLRMHSIATDGELDKMANRLIKKIQQDIVKVD